MVQYIMRTRVPLPAEVEMTTRERNARSFLADRLGTPVLRWDRNAFFDFRRFEFLNLFEPRCRYGGIL